MTRNTLYRLLKLNVILFFVPLAFVGDLHRALIREGMYRWKSLRQPDHITLLPKDLFLLRTEEGYHFSQGLRMELMALGAFMLVMAVFFLLTVSKEITASRPVLEAVLIGKPVESEEVDRLSRKYEIHSKVHLCLCGKNRQSATFGIFRPIIFLWGGMDEADREMILTHELCHVKRRDVLWKTMAGFVRALCFYNPCSYLLKHELDKLCEESCDEWVVQEYTYQEKARYAGLLCSSSGKNGEEDDLVACYGVDSDFKILQERIEMIMRERKKLSKVFAVLLTGVMLWAVSLTALAYEPVDVWETSEDGAEYLMGENDGCAKGVEVFFLSEEEAAQSDLFAIPQYPVLYERQWVDQDGNVYPLEDSEVGTYVICFFHDYEEGTLVQHVAHTDGSCTVYYYSARRCAKCGKIVDQELEMTVNYPNCTHNTN